MSLSSEYILVRHHLYIKMPPLGWSWQNEFWQCWPGDFDEKKYIKKKMCRKGDLFGHLYSREEPKLSDVHPDNVAATQRHLINKSIQQIRVEAQQCPDLHTLTKIFCGHDLIYVSRILVKSLCLTLEWLDNFCFNSLWPSDDTWHQRSGSTLVRVMACCLTAPSHYLNQCWLIISGVLGHSHEGKFAEMLGMLICDWKLLTQDYSCISKRPMS